MIDIGGRKQETLDKILEAVQRGEVNYSSGYNFGVTCFYCVQPVVRDAVLVTIEETHNGFKAISPYGLHENCLRTMRKDKRKADAPVRKHVYATK